MTARQEFRQHSKSTLLKAAETLMREKGTWDLQLHRLAQRWKRRLAWAAAGAFLAGVGVGSVLVWWLIRCVT
jgi:hypothetical protein